MDSWHIDLPHPHTHTEHTPRPHPFPHTPLPHSPLCHKTLCWHSDAYCLLLSARLQVRVVGGLHRPNRAMLRKSNFTRPTPPWRLWGRFSNGFSLQKSKESQKKTAKTLEAATGRAVHATNMANVCSVRRRKVEQLIKRLQLAISAGFAAISNWKSKKTAVTRN